MNQTEKKKKCSFCGQTSTDICTTATGTSICKKCVTLISKWMNEEDEKMPVSRTIKDKPAPDQMRPSQIKAHLDEYVIGQDDAKIALSVAVYNHYKRINQLIRNGVEIQKSNILMVGPTGSGKTYLVQTLAKVLGVPFAMADATSLTEAGYVGEDVESILSRLLNAADDDIELAEHGIVYIDEIDKLAKREISSVRAKDVSGEGVQQALLKLLEGSEVEVPVRSEKTSLQPNLKAMAKIDTSNILFICGGAFEGLKEPLSKSGTRSIGFGKAAESDIKLEETKVESADIVKYGFMPEFIGRLPVITVLEPLDKKAMVKILTEPKNAIVKQYQQLLAMDGIKLEFDKAALDYIAEKALEKGSGARGLRSIIESCMTRIMYEAPDMYGIERIQIIESTIETGVPILVQKKTNRAVSAV